MDASILSFVPVQGIRKYIRNYTIMLKHMFLPPCNCKELCNAKPLIVLIRQRHQMPGTAHFPESHRLLVRPQYIRALNKQHENQTLPRFMLCRRECEFLRTRPQRTRKPGELLARKRHSPSACCSPAIASRCT
jgi:hypothetical protein